MIRFGVLNVFVPLALLGCLLGGVQLLGRPSVYEEDPYSRPSFDPNSKRCRAAAAYIIKTQFNSRREHLEEDVDDFARENPSYCRDGTVAGRFQTPGGRSYEYDGWTTPSYLDLLWSRGGWPIFVEYPEKWVEICERRGKNLSPGCDGLLVYATPFGEAYDWD
ncbi:hypothetical protein ACFQI3_10180 [Hansschlegelia quercus]|uniref:Uncharacterized protein n=1 Tax=Hansschlegelia quercus TaxID=2528245 RepID=A0A4Q9GLX8_9HYPH|nr:hypothetical protein [Hansschlegelia quercus]TBN54431.1 hypothetical protein EYR15_06255 [Hansschlegelia quercus]